MAGSGSGSPHYSLRWNNHQSHILHAFDTLLQSEALVDVTLVCEDTRRVRAHKVVLSACSPFFEKIFAETPCKHPVIVLKDIRSWELQGIVDFMYKGEISVVEEQLSSLIKAAESLQVRGLSHPDQVPAQARGHPGHLSGGHPAHGLGRPQSPPQVCLEKFPHYPGSYHKDDAMSPHNGPGASSPYSPSPSDRDRDLRLSSPLRLPTIPHMPHISFTDNPPTPSGDHFCSSPLPRRKQARPRRRSGESGGALSGAQLGPLGGSQPQDLSKATSSPTAERPERLERPDRLDRLERPDRMDRLDMAENLSVKRSRPSSVGLTGSGERSGHSSRQTTPAPPTTPNAMPPNLKHESEESQSADCLDMSTDRRDFPNHVPDHPHPGLLGLRPDSSLDNPGFPNMPSLSALALTTPQHVFPLDSQLGLFPGMEACRNPLLNDMPNDRNENHHLPGGGSNPNSGPVSGSGPTTSSKRSKSKWQDGKCRPKGQHSAPRGGPPRSWTNAELTEALQHVWNKKMTTSQASRIFGIPYNSLLMYVRGKYGKSLKLEQLRKDCQGGPMGPLDLLGLPQLGHNNNQITAKEQHLEDRHRLDRDIDRDVPAMPESDLIMGPNFSPYSGANFYPDFSSFPMPVSMVHLLPQSEKNRLNQAGAGQLPLALDFASFRGDKDLDRDHDDRDSDRDRKRERKVAQAHQAILRERERELQQQQREMLQRELLQREQQQRREQREQDQGDQQRDQRDRDPPSSPRSSQSTPQPPVAPATPPSPTQENNNTNTDKLMKTQELLSFRACGGVSPKDDPMTPVSTPPLATLPTKQELVEFNGQE
ncbi:protein bric-a-brac 1 isoform X1 [Frankliniella occidentalis]|uniref:Protein bric-a-brac 1 isoform X1 n=1 Tax=Frankliniella occidentalis TaxID=133901 RepID=A0A6J1S7Y9_FRAOC|nr:protein bric-a-brac 1 isoform X1 [Frankliniella occidentalis]